jgi:hypothetical protein
VGQFTQPDSLVAQPYHPIAWNRYAYVYDNPVNYTDSTGHFIDTLWDVVDLAGNVQNCLGDSDALSCYMAPVSAVFLALPFATAGGLGDDAVKAAVRGGGVRGANVKRLPPPSWQGEKWLELKAFYERQGLSFGGAKFISIDDIRYWEGSVEKRIWLGTAEASGGFRAGREIPFPVAVFRGGKQLRSTEAARLGGMTGEDLLIHLRSGNLDNFRASSLRSRDAALREDLRTIIDYVASPTHGEGQIIFNLHKRIAPRAYTRTELEHILSNPDILARTLFVVDFYY